MAHELNQSPSKVDLPNPAGADSTVSAPSRPCWSLCSKRGRCTRWGRGRGACSLVAMLPNRVLPTAIDLACWVTRLEDENLFHPFSLKDDDIPSLRRCREITCQLPTCTSKRCATVTKIYCFGRYLKLSSVIRTS